MAAVPEALAVQNRLLVMMLAPLLHRHGWGVSAGGPARRGNFGPGSARCFYLPDRWGLR
ncbi:MAG: hypothetical protein VX893_14450 [Candidatus Latescibacterota bacterium]|nr:hypothetical protein [Candidatus Latescibacterota bacterium]